MTSGLFLIGLLVLAILFIIYATAGLKLHPFLVLLIASYGLGLLAGLPSAAVVEAIIAGFGGTIGYIGIVIAAGTIIGVILEKSGGAVVMARTVTGWIGKARSALAMSFTGAVVSIPVFCDSGYVILSPLARSLASRTGQSMATFAVALSMGLYATHVFVPPTPGPIAAAGELGADIGLVILLGLLTTLPVIAATYLFARYMGQRMYIEPDIGPAALGEQDELTADTGGEYPAPALAFAPILLPVLLIAISSIAELPARPLGDGGLFTFIQFLGNPNTALLLGVFLAFAIVKERGATVFRDWVGTGLQEAGVIILITGAGGALGAVLQATPIGSYLSETLAMLELGAFNILLPFIIAAALKTALGSSTVAIITTASLISPLLPALGLAGELGPVLATLSIGAGSMTVSHANDSYFWVVAEFSGMDVDQAYKLQTGGSAVAGITGIFAVFLLSLLFI